MKTLANNNESINGMSQVIIDMRPQVKHLESYGREKVADVYFRTLVRAYSRQVCGDYSEAAHEAAKQALKAYYSEVVELLKGEGWTLLNENYEKWQDCPEMAKGAQYLYIHPDEICGEVNPTDIETLEAKFKALTACEYRCTDNYGDIVLARSEADERMLYRETYTEGIADVIKECTTTKRSNLYKDRGDALGCIRSRIAIKNKRTDLTGHGTGHYRERKAVAGFVQEEYDRLLQAGYIKEAAGQNGRTLCRWINKKEEKELNKARREAEKAAKEREAQEKAEREAQQKNAALEQAREISDSRKADGLTIGEGELVILKDYGGALGFITKVNGDELTFRHISGNWTAHPALDEVARIEDNRPAWCKEGQTVIYNGTVYVIEVVDFYADIEHSLESDHVCCICEQGKECICQNCREVRWECLTPCTPDGRELLPEPPAEVHIDVEPTLEPASEITEKPQPSSWITDYTYDDFAKLEANPEAIEADPDIMGKRFRLTAKDGSAPLSELQVFIQDYAGNERHALYYIWDEWMQEVRANVRPLDWLREHFCHANGWQPVAA